MVIASMAGSTPLMGGPESSTAPPGSTLTALAPGPAHVWDNGNSVEVQLAFGSLESLPDTRILDGANGALINGEIDYYEQPPTDFLPISRLSSIAATNTTWQNGMPSTDQC